MYRDYIKLIIQDIKRRKFSSILTLSAISLGILSIFVIILVSQGFQQSLESEFEQFGTNLIIISSKDSNIYAGSTGSGLSSSELNLVENRPYVKDVLPIFFRQGQVKYGNEFANTFVIGLEFKEDAFDIFGIDIDLGRPPQSNDKYGAVIGPVAASDMFSKKLNVGSNIYIKDTKFKVIAILEPVGNPQDDSQLYFNIDTLQEVYDTGDKIDMIYTIVDENYDVDLAKSNLELLLENRLGDDTVELQTLAQMAEQLNEILRIIQLVLGGIAFVALIVGALGIINTMYVIITEKTKDIGIMKAVGARNQDILLIYMFQAGIFGLLGGALGLVVGALCTMAFEYFIQQAGYTFLEIGIDPFTTISLLFFSFLVGLLAGLIPAYKASKLKIVDTFRK